MKNNQLNFSCLVPYGKTITAFAFTVVFLLCTSACRPEKTKIRLQPGDLLFREAASGKLSKAIDDVTQTDSGTHFSHVGIVESVGDTVWVLHASAEGGSCRIILNDFLHPDGDSAKVAVYRLKKEWKKNIPQALARARAMLGKPYNFSYILSDTAHYCSEFIFRAFAPDSVFTLNPMTFKNPQTGNFYPTWIEYYQKLGIEIPEGFPGCNPNGLAASDKLKYLGILKPGP